MTTAGHLKEAVLTTQWPIGKSWDHGIASAVSATVTAQITRSPKHPTA